MPATSAVDSRNPADRPSSWRWTASDTVSRSGGLARQAGHGGFHDRLQRRAGGAGAVGHAGLERLLDRGGQAAVGGLGLALEGVLAGELAVIHGLALALDGVDHGLQAFGQGRQGVGLALQQLERFLALVALRIGAQRGGDAGVELLRGQDAVAPAERGQQAQHGRVATPAIEVPKAKPRP